MEFVFVSRVEEVLKQALGLDLDQGHGAVPEQGSGQIARL